MECDYLKASCHATTVSLMAKATGQNAEPPTTLTGLRTAHPAYLRRRGRPVLGQVAPLQSLPPLHRIDMRMQQLRVLVKRGRGTPAGWPTGLRNPVG